MSDDLVSRLLEHHEAMRGPDYYQAATALTEARAEIERWAAHALKEEDCREMWRTRALAAESELSTLRARVREVVGLFAAVVLPWGDIGSGMIDAKSVRAARQLMEEVK